MTKSPRAVAREAQCLAREALPAYSSKFSRKDFTQHQLFAPLFAMKTSFKTDYRGVSQIARGLRARSLTRTSAWPSRPTTRPSVTPPSGY